MKFITAIFLLFFLANIPIHGQTSRENYIGLTDKADSLYAIGEYHSAAINYSRAARFEVSGRPNDFYNAACSWALSGYPDSAFFYLESVIGNMGYSNYQQLIDDHDLQILHKDKRWTTLAEKVRRNLEIQQNISKEMWKEDILQLKDLLATWHINLYHETPKVIFDKEIQALVNGLDSLKNDEIVFEIMKIVALAKDGHTSFYPEDQKLVEFSYFPLILSEFEEGLFSISVPNYMSDLAGLKLIAIDNIKIQDVRKKLIPYIPRDNDAEVAYTYPFLIQNVDLLYFLGVINNKTSAKFTFDKEGEEKEVTINAVSLEEYDNIEWFAARSSLNKIASSSHPTFLFSNPITITKLVERPNYWSQIFDDKKTIYLQYLSCWNQEGVLTFKEYIDSNVFAYLDRHPDYQLVIDMRYNSGGDPYIAKALIEAILNREGIFKKRKPIVLVSTRTFSAAATNVCQLNDLCNAQIMGQVPRARPNSPSEGRNFQLKNSKVTISISTKMVIRDPKVGNKYFIPMNKEIPIKFSDYILDIDNTFNKAIDYNTCR